MIHRLDCMKRQEDKQAQVGRALRCCGWLLGRSRASRHDFTFGVHCNKPLDEMAGRDVDACGIDRGISGRGASLSGWLETLLTDIV